MARDWNASDCMFPIDEAYNFGVETNRQIAANIEGFCGSSDGDAGLFAQAIRLAGDGDYLELGTYYGASAILASLTKKHYGIKGDVYAIDDLTFQGEQRTAATIMHNAEKLGASIVLKVAKTNPFPYFDKQFNVVLIDAAHDLGNCLQDWINVKPVATNYVIFHDYSPGYAGVLTTVKLASFYPVHISSHTAILQNLSGGIL